MVKRGRDAREVSSVSRRRQAREPEMATGRNSSLREMVATREGNQRDSREIAQAAALRNI